MHALKMFFACVFCTLMLASSLGNGSLASTIDPTPDLVGSNGEGNVPERIPVEQALSAINRVGMREIVSAKPTPLFDFPSEFVPQRIPKEQAPEFVKKVEFTETFTVPSITDKSVDGGASVDPPGQVTLSFGFHWYQLSPSYVAVAAYSRTQTNFCATRVYAKGQLYRDVEHDGVWEFKDEDTKEQTGTCVTDSGEALTDFWSAPNNTSWKNASSHYVEWNGGGQGYERSMFDAFP